MLHLNAADTLTAVMSGAAATTNPVTLTDAGGQTTPQSMSGTTAITLARGIGGTGTEVKGVRVYNGDTAAVTVTLTHIAGGTSYAFTKKTLAVGDTWHVSTAGEVVLDSSGQLKNSSNSNVRTGFTTQIGTRAKVGTTAGWTVAAANDLPYVGTLAASQTASTLVLPIDGLHIGDTITGFKVISQIESAGGAVTLDADLRAVTNVAAEPTDASIGAITQVSVTADTASAASKTGLTEVVTSGKSYYLLITGTTAASTDTILQHCEITVTTS